MEDKKISEKQILEFFTLMTKLKPDELCALAKFLNVRLLTDDTDPETKKAIARDGKDIVEDCVTHFTQLGRQDRRFLIKYLKKQSHKKG